jgi:NADH:ubiquinone oxidoreductase subunit
MTIGTTLFTWLHGEAVGNDDQGNRYYQERKIVAGRRRRRWVIYNGEAEASRVPPEWHIWLHYTTNTPPSPGASRRPWQKPHEPNHTGTPLAYRPPGHTLSGGKRDKATGDYEPWTPN